MNCFLKGCWRLTSVRDNRRIAARATNEKNAAADNFVTFKYKSTDGHSKATIEDVYGQSAPSGVYEEAPWVLGWQMNERNMVWNDELKRNLIRRVTSEQLGISEQEVDQRLHQVVSFVPDLEVRIRAMPQDAIVALCSSVSSIPDALIKIKSIFPRANAARLAALQPALVTRKDLSPIQAAAQKLREDFPDLDVDQLVEEHPAVLNVKQFRQAVEQFQVMRPDTDVQRVLNNNPNMILAMQRGDAMIPYDVVPTRKPVEETL